MKRGRKARIFMFAVTVVLFVLTGCSTVKAAATEEDIRACNLKSGKDVLALGEATITLINPHLDVMKEAGWTVDDSAVRPMLADIHDVDMKDNCVLYRVGTHEPGAPAMSARWFGYCQGWAVKIPYYGGDWVMFSTFKRHPQETNQATEEFACVLNDGSEAIRKRYQVQP